MPNFNIKHEDKVRLRHMLDAALEVRQYVQSSMREDLNQDRKLVHSLVRLFEIIGEAASQISEEFREEVPEIPWVVIIGMRNRLIHAYFSINLDVVWSTSKDDVPSLITELKKLLD
ncbi:MAG: DUF86 domain-containing protein [Sedimentisphaerales bacterium]